MTPFAALQSLCGLSNREVASFLGMTESAVEKFRRGNREAPPGVLRELADLWGMIDAAAGDAADEMFASGIVTAKDAEIEIGYPADDHEADQLGFPCVGAWRQYLARVLDELMQCRSFDPARIKLVPRGSTPATAAAADIHRK